MGNGRQSFTSRFEAPGLPFASAGRRAAATLWRSRTLVAVLPLRCVGAAVAGVLLSLAFEPVATPWVIPVGVAGFVLAVRGLRGRRAAGVAVLFAAAFFLPHIWWMRVVGIDAWILLSAIQVAFFVVLGPVVARAQAWRGGPLLVAVAWLGAEAARMSFPWGGFPWGRLGFATVDTPFAEALPWVGVNGASLLLALAGAVLAAAVVRVAALLRARRDGEAPTWRGAAAAGAPVVAVLLLLALPALLPWRDVADPAVRDTATVAAVQGDVPGPGDDVLFDGRQLTENHVNATLDLARQVAAGEAPAPDLVVWPENSTTRDPFNDPGLNADITRAVQAVDVPVLVGAIVDGPREGTVLGQGIVWTPEGSTPEATPVRYAKHHPVPFGEYIPLRNDFFVDFVERLDLLPRDMIPGTRRTPMQVGPARVADSICFDIGFDDALYAQVEEGADLAVTQTSNAFYIFTDQVDQQFAMTRLRALETGRWMVVASTNGVTGVISPDGEVVARAGIREQAVLVEEVDLITTRPPAVFLAPWLGRGAVLATAAMLLVPWLRYRLAHRRTRRRAPGEG